MKASIVPSDEKAGEAPFATTVSAPVVKSLITTVSPPREPRLTACVTKAILLPSGEKIADVRGACVKPFASSSACVTLMRDIAPVVRSLRKRSELLLVSLPTPTRSSATDEKRTLVPSGDHTAALAFAFCASPEASVETSVTAPVVRSFMKTSLGPESPGTKTLESATNRTFVPSGENSPRPTKPEVWLPEESVLTRETAPVVRSFTKRSCVPFVSTPAPTRLSARERKVTFVPSGEIRPLKLYPSASSPAASVDTRVISPVVRFLMKTSPMPLASPGTRLE